MSSWLSRNAYPIVLVLVAAVVVIGVFEAIDAISGSSQGVEATDGADLEGAAAAAGLIKVGIFLAIGAGIARLIRRRLRSSSTA